MPHRKPSGKTREELLDEVRRLTDLVRELQQRPADSPVKTEGLAQGIAAALGRMVPGLENLIQSASQMPEFQQRLSAIDEEVKRKFKDQPLGRTSLGLAGAAGRRQIGIPPSVRRRQDASGHSQGSGNAHSPAGNVARGKHRTPAPPKVRISPETPAQLPVDIFDEGNEIVILAEAPGLKSEHVIVSLEGTVLLISVEAPNRTGLQRIELPCEVSGDPETSLANGILNIRVKKAAKQ